MIPDTLAAIVARDAALGYSEAGITATQAAADRRALLALLRETRDALDLTVAAINDPDVLGPKFKANALFVLARLAALDPEPVR